MADLIYFPLVFCLCFFLCFWGATSSPDNIFILGGQSNMAGRGGVFWDTITKHYKWDGYIPLESQSKSSILRFTAELRWELAHEPLHWDIDHGKVNGVGPGMAFANELLAKANKSIGVIGLVPCAIGGTHIREWAKGTINYTNLVDRINASEKYGGKVQAFFWFQGESDASVRVDAEFYEQNLTKFLTDLRKDLYCPNLPIILVKIASYDKLIRSPILNYTEDIRRAEEAVKQKLPKISIVDSMEAIRLAVNNHKPGLNEDGHFSVYSEVEVGKMLAHAYSQTFA